MKTFEKPDWTSSTEYRELYEEYEYIKNSLISATHALRSIAKSAMIHSVGCEETDCSCGAANLEKKVVEALERIAKEYGGYKK
jgi:hypothetical protein